MYLIFATFQKMCEIHISGLKGAFPNNRELTAPVNDTYDYDRKYKLGKSKIEKH